MAVNTGAGRPVYNPRPDILTSINQGTGMVAPTNTGVTDWQEVINTDPNLQKITDPEARTNYLRAVWGLSNAYKIDNAGNIVDSYGYLLRNLWWIGPAAIVGGSAIAAAAGGGSGGAGVAAAGSTGAGASAAGGAGTAGSVGGTAAGATVAGSLGKTLLNYGLQYGLPIAGNLISSKIQSNAASDAARLEQEALDKALAQQQKELDYQHEQDKIALERAAEQTAYGRAQYDEATNYGRRTYGDFVTTLEPYRQAGTTASDRMAQLLGLSITPNSGTDYNRLAATGSTPTNLASQFPGYYDPVSAGAPATAATPPVQQGITNQAAPPTSGTNPVGQTALLQTPDGRTAQIPLDQVDYYVGLGARRVG